MTKFIHSLIYDDDTIVLMTTFFSVNNKKSCMKGIFKYFMSIFKMPMSI